MLLYREQQRSKSPSHHCLEGTKWHEEPLPGRAGKGGCHVSLFYIFITIFFFHSFVLFLLFVMFCKQGNFLSLFLAFFSDNDGLHGMILHFSFFVHIHSTHLSPLTDVIILLFSLFSFVISNNSLSIHIFRSRCILFYFFLRFILTPPPLLPLFPAQFPDTS